MKICQNCGSEVSDTAKFCRKCGSKLEAAAAEPQGTPEEPSEEGFHEEEFSENDSVQVSSPQENFTAAEPAASDQSFGMGAGTAEYIGEEYQWGPPTGGDDYDEPAMPAVFVGGAEEESEEKPEDGQKPYTYQIEGPSFDHTGDYDPKDISANKVTAMAAYVLGALGVIIALLAGQDSPYADFHMRQGLKFVVVEALVTIIALLLCWTLIIPAAAAVFMIILWVIKIITIISVCRGKAVEPAIIRSMSFLK